MALYLNICRKELFFVNKGIVPGLWKTLTTTNCSTEEAVQHYSRHSSASFSGDSTSESTFHFQQTNNTKTTSALSQPLICSNCIHDHSLLLTSQGSFVSLVRHFGTSRTNEGEGDSKQTNGSRRNEVTYEELLSLLDEEGVRLVDVREPRELEETGRIGNAINIPVTKLKSSLSMAAEEFSETYGVPKPDKMAAQLVFYGLSSVKANAALELAKKSGYEKARHFPGGWTEWASRQSQ